MCVSVCACVCVRALWQKGRASQQNVEINTDAAQIVKNYLHDGLQMIAALELRPSESNTCTPPTSRGTSHTGDARAPAPTPHLSLPLITGRCIPKKKYTCRDIRAYVDAGGREDAEESKSGVSIRLRGHGK